MKKGVEALQAILQVWHLGGEGLGDGGRQIAEGTTEAMAPALLAVVKMQGLQGFFRRLMAGETSPLVEAGTGAELGLSQVGLGLMQPIGGAIHGCSLVQGEGGPMLESAEGGGLQPRLDCVLPIKTALPVKTALPIKSGNHRSQPKS